MTATPMWSLGMALLEARGGRFRAAVPVSGGRRRGGPIRANRFDSCRKLRVRYQNMSRVCPDILTAKTESVRPAAHGTEAARAVVPGGAGLDGQRYLRLDRVEVLLDDARDVAVEGGERREELGHVGLAEGRLAHHAERDGLGERQLLAAHAFADLGIDLLEVHIRDAVGELPDDLDVVAVAVRDVPGVEAQVDERGVG